MSARQQVCLEQNKINSLEKTPRSSILPKAKGNNSESHGANLMAIERLPQRQKPNPL
jgi:hypothetical protein